MRHAMMFSWKAIGFAPLVVPFVCGAGFACLAPGPHPIWGFLFVFIPGSIFSYVVSVFLLLPSLFLASRFMALTARLTGLVGAMLGVLAYFPVSWPMYVSSGVDSGPPEGTFAQYLWRNMFPMELPAFLMAGLATAMLYWFLASLSFRKKDQLTTSRLF